MNRNLLFTIVIFLLTSLLPTFAAPNWVQIHEKQYIDVNSIRKENYLSFDNSNYYSIWIKQLNDNSDVWLSLESYYKSKLWYTLNQYYFDCNNKRVAVKSTIAYDIKGSPIFNSQSTISDAFLQFNGIAPATVAELGYNFACNGAF